MPLSTRPDFSPLHHKAAAKLLTSLAAKGATATDEPDTVMLGFADLKARCIVFDAHQQEGLHAVALGIEVTGPGLAQPVRDAGGARAPTLDEALDAAVQGWLAGLFIPLRDALGDDYVPYRYKVSQRRDDPEDAPEWSVYESPLHIGGSGDVHEKLMEKFKEPPLFGWVVRGGALPPLTEGQLHWLKLGVVGKDSQTLQVECAFDGEPWKGCESLFSDLSWPGQGLQMVRQYWVLVAN